MEEVSDNQNDGQSKKVDKTSLKTRLRAWLATKKGKTVSILLVLLILLAALLLIPAFRDGTFGQVVRKTVVVTVLDDRSNQPVSSATVKIGDVSAETDAKGVASLKNVKAIKSTIEVTKTNYEAKTSTYTVPFFAGDGNKQVSLHATGKSYVVNVVNAVSLQPTAGATIKSGSASAVSSNDGKATLVLPYQNDEQTVSISQNGYLDASTKVATSKDQPTIDVKLVPSGKITYLSKATGTINVMQSNLDGSESQIIAQGTGREDDAQTTLLSSRDWKYSVLLTRKDSKINQLYLIDAASKQKTLIDEGEVSFDLKGWSGHVFVYTVSRYNQQAWESNNSSLKFYNADNKSLKDVDNTSAKYDEASGNYRTEYYSGVFILDNEVVATKYWSYGNRFGYSYTSDEKTDMSLVSINPNSLAKNTKKTWQQDSRTSMDSRLYEPQAVYVQISPNYDTTKASYYEYEKGAVEQKTDIDNTKFTQSYPTYLISPSGKKSFWYDDRNGKKTLFVGDLYGKNEQKIADLSDYKPYGWYGESDQYLLVTKDDSQLYVATSEKIGQKHYQPLEISTIHKPAYRYSGYGYGYGGQ